jgi:hypothetical protein
MLQGVRRILINGGRDADETLVAASEIFDSEAQVSTASASLNTAHIAFRVSGHGPSKPGRLLSPGLRSSSS